MTDSQSFYLILWLFYLIDCMKLLPSGSIMVCGRRGKMSKGWKRKHALLKFGGISKDMIPAMLLPWPSICVMARSDAKPAQSGQPNKPHQIRRMSLFLLRASADMRVLATMIFLHFFVLLPAIYHLRRGEILIILVFVGIGFLMMWVNTLSFYFIHRRLLPTLREERAKACFMSALLPWHAMRCADEITLQASRNWYSPALLAAHADNMENLKTLQLLYRRSVHQKNSPHSTKELDAVLENSNLDTSAWLNAPEQNEYGSHYCPCCHQSYTSAQDSCSDCEGVPIIAYDNKI